MVFVSVGTQKQQFLRIFKMVENSKVLKDDEIVAQTGNTKFSSKKIKMIKSIDTSKFNEYIKKADFVICHGGVGTIFNALENNKRVLVVPRLGKYNEHINDHQLEVAGELEKEGYLLMYKDGENFDDYVKKLKEFTPKKYSRSEKFLDILRKEI